MAVEYNEQPERALGLAGHPQAIERLLELWPSAHVWVTYAVHGGRRVTLVGIAPSQATTPMFFGRAYCSPPDQFSRRRGREIAFRRALVRLSRYATRKQTRGNPA